ncbi:MAG: hypothetical protein WB902_02415 [Acetobacteraceae bacterium]
MMEGVAAEAASLAGQLRLGRLIVLYDANQTTLSAAVCRSACGQWADGDRTKPHWDDTIGLPPADG